MIGLEQDLTVAAGKAPVALADVLGWVAGAGLDDAIGARVGLRLSFNDRTMRTDSGCTLPDPEMVR